MHQANGSGLQQHSIGEDYPWTVVGTIDEWGDTKYYVANLETNQRMEQEFFTCSLAHRYARELRYDQKAFNLMEWRRS